MLASRTMQFLLLFLGSVRIYCGAAGDGEGEGEGVTVVDLLGVGSTVLLEECDGVAVLLEECVAEDEGGAVELEGDGAIVVDEAVVGMILEV